MMYNNNVGYLPRICGEYFVLPNGYEPAEYSPPPGSSFNG